MSGATGSRRTLGVCSWSLQAASARELAQRVTDCGLAAVQLALDPLRTGAMPLEEVREALAGAGIAVISGMMTTAGEDYSTLASIRRTGGLRPQATWDANVAAATASARLARTLGIGLVTLHAGFLPHEPADPERRVLLDRLARFADIFGSEGVTLALETGQETAETLVGVLEQLGRDDVGVNFDPANMILYGMGDPVAALRTLAPWVRQIHIKDALPAARAGEWGAEVPMGEGAVAWDAFFGAVAETRLEVNLAIEREAGDRRVEDVRRARELVVRLAGARASAS